MIVNSKYDNIILPSTSTPSNIQNRVGAGFPLDWHVKEACNCQSWMLSYSLMMMSSNSKNLTARIIGSNYISRSCLFPIWEEESLMGWDGWRLLWFLSDQKQFFSYNISIFLSLLGSLKMKKKLSEEALCPFQLLYYEQTIKPNNLFAEKKKPARARHFIIFLSSGHNFPFPFLRTWLRSLPNVICIFCAKECRGRTIKEVTFTCAN